MTRRSRDREADSFSVSFLDVAACGFGAMIILLMITKSSDPVSIEFADVTPEGAIIELQEQLFAIRGETTIFNRDLNAKHEQISSLTERIARLLPMMREQRRLLLEILARRALQCAAAQHAGSSRRPRG